ncbi:MAG TPA: metal-sensitive transcriptional regulator [Acidimicrobiia bacterium]|nr:metal-sensitive transcriptional regulator [Acidimicrobiia bacterium]
MRAEAATVGFKLRSLRGHIDGVIRMVEGDRYCIDVLHQLSAVQGALDGVRRDILEAHLRGCVPEAVSEGRIDDIVDELLGAAFGAPPHSQQQIHHCRMEAVSSGIGADA